jgi:hypothetical protein
MRARASTPHITPLLVPSSCDALPASLLVMADVKKGTDGPEPYSNLGFDFTLLPDYNDDFINEDDFNEFAKALAAPEQLLSPSTEDLTNPARSSRPSTTGAQSIIGYGGGRRAKHLLGEERTRHARASYTCC